VLLGFVSAVEGGEEEDKAQLKWYAFEKEVKPSKKASKMVIKVEKGHKRS
jgi:hypothetical protein